MKAFQHYYPEEFSHCFGCGVHNEKGHHLESFWDGDTTVARFIPEPHYTAIPGTVYGGLLASLIDCHGTGSAAAFAHRAEGRELGSEPRMRFVTGKLEVTYKAPTPMGEELEIRAFEAEVSGRKVVVEVTVSSGGQVTATGNVVAIRIA